MALTGVLALPGLPARAEIPAAEAPGLYAQTLAGYKQLSPLWGLVALRSGVLANIRFYGGYGPTPRPAFPSLNAEPGGDDFPQDAVSGVVQFLFPSPDGHNLVHNERAKDPIGQIARELEAQRKAPSHSGGLRRILALLEATAHYRRQCLQAAPALKASADHSARDFEAAVFRILQPPNPKGRVGKSNAEAGESGFNRLRRQFAELMVRAVQEEAIPGSVKYPPDIVEVALLAYAWRAADSAAELHAAFDGHLLEPSAPGERPGVLEGTDPFQRLMEHLDVSGAELGAEELASALIAYQENQKRVPALVDYQTSTFQGTAFPDCGETSLRNFFNIAFNDKGLVPGPVVDDFLARFTLPESKGERPTPLEAFRAFYRKYPAQALQGSSAAHDDWSKVVSGLNHEPADPLPIHYRFGNCNLAGVGLENLLNLVAHLLPDPLLNQAWPADAPGRNRLAAEKLTRLCALASRPGSTLDWSVNGTKAISTDYPTLTFTLNDAPAFDWAFSRGHFAIRDTARKEAMAWIPKAMAGTRDPWLRLWLPAFGSPARASGLRVSYEFFGLAEPQDLPATVTTVLRSGNVALAPNLSRIIGRNLIADPHAYVTLFSALDEFSQAPFFHRFYPIDSLRRLPLAEKNRRMLSDGDARVKAVLLWLDHGADAHSRDQRGTPLICAMCPVTKDILKYLPRFLKAGLDVNARMPDGNNALHHSIAPEFTDIAEPYAILVKIGVDPLARNAMGETPLELLRSRMLSDPYASMYFEVKGIEETLAKAEKEAKTGTKAPHPAGPPTPSYPW